MTAVIGPAGQGIEARQLAELLMAIEAGHTYANVHSTKWPGGEIRAQIGSPRGPDSDGEARELNGRRGRIPGVRSRRA